MTQDNKDKLLELKSALIVELMEICKENGINVWSPLMDEIEELENER